MSTPHARAPRRGGARRATTRVGLGHAVRWTIGVVVVPAVVVAVAGLLVLRSRRSELLALVVEPRSLLVVAVGCAGLALVWALVVAATYHRTRPDHPTRGQHWAGRSMAVVLCLVVVAPLATGGYYALVQRDLINSVVTNEKSVTAPQITHATSENRWGDKKRVNLLLLGGDGGVGRTGVRTDTVILVSIDTRTGAAVMFSLPRNLRNVPFPSDSPLAALYPDGFNQCCTDGESMLNAIYRNVPAAHPGVLRGSTNEGADALKLGVSGALGIPVDYYVLVNLAGFRQIVDAIGGITVNINERVPINGNTDKHILPTGYLEPGPDQHLNGFKALWFTRGRYGSTDYKRMERQRCAMNAIVKRAKPVTLLTRYTRLASASKKILRTDIPQKLLPAFVDTSLKMKKHPLRSVVFQLSDSFNPNDPDYDAVHAAVQKALHPVKKKRRPAAVRAAATAVDVGTGALEPTGADVRNTEATDADDDCTYQPVDATTSASGQASSTP